MPRIRALPVERTLRPGSSMITEMNVDLPVPLRPTSADLLAGADHEGRVAEQGAVTDLDGEGGADDHRR